MSARDATWLALVLGLMLGTAGLVVWVHYKTAPTSLAQPVATSPVRAVLPVPVAAPSAAVEPEPERLSLRMQATAGPPLGGLGPPLLLGGKVDALHARATSGDTAAMLELGTGLHACLSHWRDPDAREPWQRLQMELQANENRNRAQVEDDRQSWDRYERIMASHIDCMAIGKERAATGLAWLERAARAGDMHAKIAFARSALDEDAYADVGELYAALDEVIRRRDLADAWVREAIASGERSALGAIGNASESMVPDARDRAVYALAWSMVLRRDFGDAPWAQTVQQNLQRDLYLQAGQDWVRDDAVWDSFEADARRIVERTSPLPPEQAPRVRPPGG